MNPDISKPLAPLRTPRLEMLRPEMILLHPLSRRTYSPGLVLVTDQVVPTASSVLCQFLDQGGTRLGPNIYYLRWSPQFLKLRINVLYFDLETI